METLDVHNKRAAKADVLRDHALKLAGVTCPKCGEELEWRDGGGQNHSPTGGFWLAGAFIPVHCVHCEYCGSYIKE